MGKETSEPHVDRRVRRTKKMLKEALIALMEQKRIQDISVREIAELADFNRGTFYLHYKDAYDLLDQIERETIDALEALLDAYMPRGTPRDPIDMLRHVFEFLRDNADVGRVLLGPNGDLSFVTRIKVIVNEHLRGVISPETTGRSAASVDYLSAYIVSGFIGLFEAWLSRDMQESPNEMAELARLFITGNLPAYFG